MDGIVKEGFRRLGERSRGEAVAQDDYYYEIQLTNKQLVFYFMAGATGLILSFLAGVMVGRSVEGACRAPFRPSRHRGAGRHRGDAASHGDADDRRPHLRPAPGVRAPRGRSRRAPACGHRPLRRRAVPHRARRPRRRPRRRHPLLRLPRHPSATPSTRHTRTVAPTPSPPRPTPRPTVTPRPAPTPAYGPGTQGGHLRPAPARGRSRCPGPSRARWGPSRTVRRPTRSSAA